MTDDGDRLRIILAEARIVIGTQVSADTPLLAIATDSLLAVEFCARLETALQVTVHEEDLFDCEDYRALARRTEQAPRRS
jgi:hypothetical protein